MLEQTGPISLDCVLGLLGLPARYKSYRYALKDLIPTIIQLYYGARYTRGAHCERVSGNKKVAFFYPTTSVNNIHMPT